MLNHQKVLTKISLIKDKLFPDNSSEILLAKEIWNEIVKDPLFNAQVESSTLPYLVPGWSGKLNDKFFTNQDLTNYTVLAVDGSQIYPDRHIQSNCFLINIGSTLLQYGTSSSVSLSTEPEVFLMDQERDNTFTPVDFVDLKREELEFKKALDLVSYLKQPAIVLFDGSLIFWHLEGKSQELRKIFLNSYMSYLNKFYENNCVIAGYISSPGSRELANLIRFRLTQKSIEKQINLSDAQVTQFFLQNGERTIIFSSKSKIVDSYPDHLKPHFFYLHVGEEIARIEIPAWIAANDELVQLICKITLDQSKKGMGYPVALAEAHEQAVVKGPDKEFFYHLLHKISIEEARNFTMSQKSMKKKRMGF